MHKLIVMITTLTAALSTEWTWNAMASDTRLSNTLTIEQITDTVMHDLPPGTPLSQIDKYLAENGVEHGYYKKPNQVLAMLNHIKGGQMIIDKGAQIVINLNEAHQVSSIEVRPVFTGP